jgi:hypothetical protein
MGGLWGPAATESEQANNTRERTTTLSVSLENKQRLLLLRCPCLEEENTRGLTQGHMQVD